MSGIKSVELPLTLRIRSTNCKIFNDERHFSVRGLVKHRSRSAWSAQQASLGTGSVTISDQSLPATTDVLDLVDFDSSVLVDSEILELFQDSWDVS
jgi:hypothetical protein